MAANQRRPLRPLQLNRTTKHLVELGSRVSKLPDRVPQRSLAPNWVSPTEGNGAGLPRTDLHIALIADSIDSALILERIKVVQPPLWPGKVHLHIITGGTLTPDDVLIEQTLADLGWADSRDLHIGPPASVTQGYPSGTEK